MQRSDIDLLNFELVDVNRRVQEDRESAVRFMVELIFAVDRAVELMAAASPLLTNKLALEYLLPA